MEGVGGMRRECRAGVSRPSGGRLTDPERHLVRVISARGCVAPTGEVTGSLTNPVGSDHRHGARGYIWCPTWGPSSYSCCLKRPALDGNATVPIRNSQDHSEFAPSYSCRAPYADGCDEALTSIFAGAIDDKKKQHSGSCYIMADEEIRVILKMQPQMKT